MRAAFVLPLSLLLAACGGTGDNGNDQQLQAGPNPDFVLGADDSKRVIRIRSGRRFGVALSDNASIGDVWRVADVPANLADEGFLYQGQPSDAAGAGTQKLFRFSGTSPGRGTLRLALDYRGEHKRTLEFEVITE